MQEIFPIASGFIIGLGVQQIANPKLRTAVLIILCLIFGFIASYISGELAVSWGFLTVDAVLVWVGAAIGTAVAFGWRRRSLWLRGS